MDDITCLMITVNRVPKDWAVFHLETLKQAIGDTPLITIDKDMQPEPSQSNVYAQMLRGAKMATTPYIGMVEDDVLYSKEHFQFRPPLDTFAYNMHRWSLFTWRPIYNYRGRRGNFALIAPRVLLIEALEERFAKYPVIPEDLNGELGRERIERKLGVTPRKSMEFYSEIAIVVFHHDYEMDRVAREHRKRMGAIRAYDIPHWNRAEDLVKHFK